MSTRDDKPIEERTIGGYLDAIASSAPAPGGGSVAAIVGALGAALGQMVVSLTKDDPDGELSQANGDLERQRARLLNSAEADEAAYAGYVAAAAARSSDEGKAARRTAMQVALIEAAEVPLESADAALEILRLLKPVIAVGNLHVLSDADIAVTLAHAAAGSALANVRVNVPLIRDPERASALAERAVAVETAATELATACRTLLATRREH